MKVVVAAGGRFHAFHLANQLEKREALKKLFTFSYSKSDQEYISQELVNNLIIPKYFDFFFNKLCISKVINKSKFHYLNDNFFDYLLKDKIKKIGAVDIFVGWSHYFLNSLPAIKKTGAKIVVECGSTHVLEQLKLLKEEYKKFGVSSPPIHKKKIAKMLHEYESADYIMTCSNFTYNSFIKQGISPEKVLKVPYGVDLDFFLSDSSRDKTNEKFRVISVGLMCLRKGIPYLLQAWNKLNLPTQNAELLLVGSLQEDLKQVLQNTKLPFNVKFVGAVNREKLLHLYKSSSLFVLPSIEEGMSMVIAESMANGLPIICTTNTGGEELIEDSAQGFITPIRDSDALSEKILWCYQNRDKAKEMGLLGRQRVSEFTWDSYGQKVFQIYKSILGRK